MKLIIDNTRTTGNFFDNINNYNNFSYEFIIDDETNFNEIKKYINNESSLSIKKLNNEELSDYWGGDFNICSTKKYDYINEDNLSEYINDADEMLFGKQDEWFKLTKNQYAQKLKFKKEHYDCLIDKDTMRHRFGTIGGGIIVKYKMSKDSIKPFIRCEWCKEEKELIDEFPKDLDIVQEELDKKYDIECKYPDKLNKVEFYRLMEILKDNNYNPLEISFMGTGLGNIVNVKTLKYNFSITDTTHW